MSKTKHNYAEDKPRNTLH